MKRHSIKHLCDTWEQQIHFERVLHDRYRSNYPTGIELLDMATP